jgi:acetyltransferase-like isoleucine patch superfamily enzyme
MLTYYLAYKIKKMKKEELKKTKQLVKDFLKSNKKVLEIEYKNSHFNPTKYYHKVLFKNPITHFWKYFISLFCYILPASWFKNLLYKSLGMKIGKDVSISAGAMFDLGYPQLISLGDGTIIGTGVKILTHETTITNMRIGRVIIGKKVLVGVRSVIRCGVSIGNNSIIGIMSYVNTDVKANEFVGGVPAKKIK